MFAIQEDQHVTARHGVQVSAELQLQSIPMLAGAAECVAAGVLSSIHIQNAKVSAAVQNAEAATQHEAWPLLVDPQTGTDTHYAQGVHAARCCRPA